MKPAILIVDMLEDFFRDGRLKEHRDSLVLHINALTSFARQHSIPVIWVRQEFKSDLSDAFLAMRKHNYPITIEGTKGSKILGELQRTGSDYIIIKKRYSAFFKTTLDEVLQKIEADTLIIGGVNTHACIRMAAIDAYQRDYAVILASDCIDSYDEDNHRSSLQYLTKNMTSAMSNKELFSIHPWII